MATQGDNWQYADGVVLPSGKATEIACSECSSDLVYPVEWAEAGTEHWHVTIQCPNCDWTGSGVFSDELLEWFDEQLDRGTEALVRDLRRLTRANLADEIERFSAALRADAILPEDF